MRKHLNQAHREIDELRHHEFDEVIADSFGRIIRDLGDVAVREGHPAIVELCNVRSQLSPATARLIVSQCIATLDNSEQPLTAPQAAERLGVSTRKVYQLCKDGLIKHSKGPIRIMPDAIVKYQQQETVDPTLVHLQ